MYGRTYRVLWDCPSITTTRQRRDDDGRWCGRATYMVCWVRYCSKKLNLHTFQRRRNQVSRTGCTSNWRLTAAMMAQQCSSTWWGNPCCHFRRLLKTWVPSCCCEGSVVSSRSQFKEVEIVVVEMGDAPVAVCLETRLAVISLSSMSIKFKVSAFGF